MISFKWFSKSEFVSVVIIFLVLILAVALNLRVSLRRSRDSQRRSDIRSIHDGLKIYQGDFGFFPMSNKGQIVACNGTLDSKGSPVFEPCEWFLDSLADQFDENYPPYLKSIQTDPNHNDGARYHYISNGSRFQIYGSFEGYDEPEYDTAIVARDLACGNQICNFGRGYSDTPLDKSIEEYENELGEKNK